MGVRTERRGRVFVVTMEREEKRNAIDAEMTAALDAALNELDDDGELWVGVLTGGPRMFCAGTDMKRGSGTPTPRGGIYGVVGRRRRKPLIAAVEGFAFGGGFEIALACDMIVAGESARFGLPEVKRGLLPTSGGIFRAPRALPLNVAKEMILSGADEGAERLERLGVVNRITPDGEALDGALALAESLIRNSPVAVQQTLQAVARFTGADDDDGWACTAEARHVMEHSEDRVEGVAAFFERREPNWPGR